MKTSTILKVALSMIAAVAFSFSTVQAENIEWSAGSVGGSWFSAVTGLSKIVTDENKDLHIRIVPGGGRDNPSKIAGGISQIALGIDFLAAAALKGEPPYKAPAENLRTLGGTWMTTQFHVIVPVDEKRTMSEIFSDPKIRVGSPPRATSESLTLIRVLDYYNNPINTIKKSGGKVIHASYSQLISAYQNKQVDVIFGCGTAPTGIALEVEAGRRQGKLIPFPEKLMTELNKNYGYGISKIAAGSYKKLQTEGGPDIPVTVMGTVILVDSKLSDKLVYRIMKSLLKNQDQFKNIHAALTGFDPKLAWQNPPVPLHSGAERAYRELGYMN